MDKTKRKIMFMSMFFLLMWFSFSFFGGERVKVNAGLGWDGVFYAQVALNPVNYIAEIGVNNYQFQRLLPSIVVHYGSKLVGYKLGTNIYEPQAVINAFMFYNILLIICSVVIFYFISKQLKWKPSIFFLGIVSLFVNFPILKLSTYNPTLTDVSAIFVSLLIIYFYLKGWQYSIFAAALFASFVWPTILYTSTLLLIFDLKNLENKKFIPSNRINYVSLCLALFLAVFVYIDYSYNKIILPNGANQVNGSLVVLSIILFAVFIYFVFRQFIDFSYFKKIGFQSINRRGVILAVILYLTVKLIITGYSKGQFYISPVLQLRYMGQTFIVNPFVSIVSHVAYFGPIVILILLYWENIVSCTKKYGLGLFLVLVFCTLFSVGSESRQSMAAWPIFSIMICEVLNSRGVPWRMSSALFFVSLLTSKFWLNINGKEEWSGPLTDFPYQMLFMNFGPWLSNSMYYVFAAITFILFLWIFYYKVSTQKMATCDVVVEKKVDQIR